MLATYTEGPTLQPVSPSIGSEQLYTQVLVYTVPYGATTARAADGGIIMFQF